MTDAIKKLREPAALAAAAYAALSVLASVIELLFSGGGNFSAKAAGQTGSLLSFPVALALAIAVFLANHVEPALVKARLVTLVSLITAGVAAVFGLVSFFAGFGYGGYDSTGKVAYFLAGAGGGLALAVAAWYVWLSWQTHAPARVAEPAAAPQAGGPVGWGAPQGQAGQPQQQQAGPGGAPQGQQPAGFGWTPGNPNEQTAYLPPQAAPGPQTLQAQQSHSGTYSVPQAQQQGQPGQHSQPGQPGQPQGHDAYGAPLGQQGQQQHQQAQHQHQQPQPGPAQGHDAYGAPSGQQQPYPGQPGPQQQAPGAGMPQQGGSERTQMMPPVPPTMQDYAPDPQPWQPAGPGGAQVPPPPARPMHAAEQQPNENERNDGRQGPFGVGNWQ